MTSHCQVKRGGNNQLTKIMQPKGKETRTMIAHTSVNAHRRRDSSHSCEIILIGIHGDTFLQTLVHWRREDAGSCVVYGCVCFCSLCKYRTIIINERHEVICERSQRNVESVQVNWRVPSFSHWFSVTLRKHKMYYKWHKNGLTCKPYEIFGMVYQRKQTYDMSECTGTWSTA